MAGNDWINGYLDAILDAGKGAAGGEAGAKAKPSLLLRERGHFSPARYFVEEVITGYDETELHKTWLRAAAMRSPQERNTRLENMTWRIWNLARKKKEIEKEEARTASKQRLEIERGRREAAADMSENLSEGEKEHDASDLSSHDSSRRGRMPRIFSMDAISDWHNINSRMSSSDASADSASQLNNRISPIDASVDWDSQLKDKKLYIVLISIHGLVRGDNMELGRDSDTGGQVKYVVELARALGSSPGVYRVDLLTRQISAPDVHESYDKPTEILNLRSSGNFAQEMGKNSGAYIVRIPFGLKQKYIHKEHLWPYIQEFVDRSLSHIKQMSKVLGEEIGGGQPVWPVAIHGHYADAGDSAALLSGALNVPIVFTGHSLGRDKLLQFLKQGRQTREEINAQYKIMRRIEAEELALDTSEIIITSTRQEIEQQWELYDGFNLTLARKLKARTKRGVSCYGRYMPRMVIIPPGMEFHHIVAHDDDSDEEVKEVSSGSKDPEIWSQIMRFLNYPRKPMILALARPDPKKNLTTLVKAFGECSRLRELANLVLIMGNRDDLDEMPATNAAYLISILKLIDKYDLYGQVAYPKHHKQSEVPDVYRLAAKTKGVFINPAFIEPFGLTLIEAAAYGLPIVATKNGGPVDIHWVLENGILVDPHDREAIADALYKLVSNKQLWKTCRKNGLKNIHKFSWPEHCKNYLSKIISLRPRHPQWPRNENIDENSVLDSLGESSDIQDITLKMKLSLEDGEPEDGGGQDIMLDEEESAPNGNAGLEIRKLTNGVARAMWKNDCEERTDMGSNLAKQPSLMRRKHIFVIAVDSVNKENLIQIIKSIFEASYTECLEGSIGFVLSSFLTMAEVHSLLVSADVLPSDFDAFICNSGSDLYYPSSCSDDRLSSSELPFAIDPDYHSQIEYRWGGEGLRKTLVRWADSIKEKKGETEEQVVLEDVEHSSTYCLAFKVMDSEKLPPVHELRKLMRIQALRCHIVYSHDCTMLHAIPVLASRSQALRYLYIRWGIELSNIVVFVGESGDTDYEGLLGGLHKTVVLRGPFNNAPCKLLTARSYPLEDVVAFESSNIIKTEGCSTNDIKLVLQQCVFSKV